MKIGMVFPAVEYGGQEKNLILLSNELHKNKYEVEVLSYGEKSFSTNKLNSNIMRINLESSGYKFFILNFIITLVSRGMLKIYLKSLIKIFGYLFNNEYKVLICFQSGGLVSILKAITRSKTKIITRESTSPIQMSKLQKSILPFSIKVKIKKFLYKFSDTIVANSTGTKDEINNLLKKNKAITIENICDYSGMKIDKDNNFHPIFKKQSYKLITVGRLNQTKRVDIIIKALKEISSTINIDLIIVGEGPEKSKLENLAKDINISDKVHFIGFSNEVHKWIINSDIYISASIVEGSPNSIIESVCLGIPVIAADCNHGPKEILDNGKIGILVPINDIKEMILKISNLLNNKELMKKLSILSLGKKQVYSPQRVSNLYIKEIQKLNESK